MQCNAVLRRTARHGREFGHEGARSLAADDRGRSLEVRVYRRHRHGRDTQMFGKVAHRRQPFAGSQRAERDAELDQSAQLRADRDR